MIQVIFKELFGEYFTVRCMMKALAKLTWTDLKLYGRNFIAIFFVLLFPLLMLFMYGNLNGGNRPSDLLGGRGVVDYLIPDLHGFAIKAGIS